MSKDEKLKRYADQFVGENYSRLVEKFKPLDDHINQKGYGSLDKLNDTIILIYETDKTFNSYEQFYRFAASKFIGRTKKPKPGEAAVEEDDPGDDIPMD